MEGNTALGASSPAKPALHMPEPLSTTRAATSSSHILIKPRLLYRMNMRRVSLLIADLRLTGYVQRHQPILLFDPWSDPSYVTRIESQGKCAEKFFACAYHAKLHEVKHFPLGNLELSHFDGLFLGFVSLTYTMCVYVSCKTLPIFFMQHSKLYDCCVLIWFNRYSNKIFITTFIVR